jgi:hypothetical protein
VGGQISCTHASLTPPGWNSNSIALWSHHQHPLTFPTKFAVSALSTADAPGAAKRVHADWTLVLGESAVDIRLLRLLPPQLNDALTAASTTATPSGSRRDLLASSSPSAVRQAGGGGGGGQRPAATQELLVVCEHCLFIVSATQGRLLLQRRLEYHPAACWPYPAPSPPTGGPGRYPAGGAGGLSGSSGADNLLVATHTKALLVYEGPALVWAARLELLPVAVRVAAVGGVEGMVVALDDRGGVICFAGLGLVWLR